MKVIIDSVCMNALLRTPASKGGRLKRLKPNLATSLDRYIKKKRLEVVLDSKNVLKSEWEETCGQEVIKLIVISWVDMDGVILIDNISKLGRSINVKLKDLGFHDTVDKFIVRLAASIDDRNIVTNDSDFWDPADVQRKGDESAPVAILLSDVLGIRVLLLKDLFKMI